MRLSRFPLFTTRETPADAEIISHQLMLRAGMIRRVASGLYSWLPLGLRVVHRISAIVREEMNRSGALEVLMPSVQPAELWQASGRWENYDAELLRFNDRHDREFCYGPTHEEVITRHAAQELRSYKQLPINFYQIQTKFRDEIRPRFGVMRAREFVMKDAYSFHMSESSLAETYADMRTAYQRIFDRLGVRYRIVQADSGNIGGSASEEFHVLAETGEDLLAVSDTGDYAANVEAATAALLPDSANKPGEPGERMAPVDTPGISSIEEVSQALDVDPASCVKSLAVQGADGGLVLLLLRGDHELNPIKAARLPAVADPLQMADESEIRSALGAGPGSIGPVEADIPVIADHAVGALSDFVCGANRDGVHLRGVNWGRDLPEAESADLRMVVAGDPAPDGSGKLELIRGIEVGHIFQLGRKYTDAMGMRVLDENGKEQIPEMGCYGIGVTRCVGAVIEQSHDDNGIIWPASVAPFEVILCPINMHKSQRLREAAEALYSELLEAGIDVVIDDRPLRPGVIFADADLIGIPHRVVVGERGLDRGKLEYKARTDAEACDIDFSAAAIIERVRNGGA